MDRLAAEPIPPKSIVLRNAEEDPTYAPYCMRCTTMARMIKDAPFLWHCRAWCGAVHDERDFHALHAAVDRLTREKQECMAEHDGYFCTLRPSHDGDHKAYRIEFCTSWPAAARASSPLEPTT